MTTHVGDYAGAPRLDPINERQTVTTGTQAALAASQATAEAIGEQDFREPTPETATKGAHETVEALIFPKGRILMSYANPEGMKLEELADRLTREMLIKSDGIANVVLEASPRGRAARIATENNGRIIGLLQQIKSIQLDSMAAFAEVGPDRGPNPIPEPGPDAIRVAGVKVTRHGVLQDIDRSDYLFEDPQYTCSALETLKSRYALLGRGICLVLPVRNEGTHTLYDFEAQLFDRIVIRSPAGDEVLKDRDGAATDAAP